MPTSTSFAVGLAFLTASATLAFSASVKLAGSLTDVLAGSLTPSATLAGAVVSLVTNSDNGFLSVDPSV